MESSPGLLLSAYSVKRAGFETDRLHTSSEEVRMSFLVRCVYIYAAVALQPKSSLSLLSALPPGFCLSEAFDEVSKQYFCTR